MSAAQTDPELDALVERILAGEPVSDDEAVAAHNAATGRSWLAGLRARRDERLAAEAERRDAELRRVLATEDVRAGLARSSPTRIAEAYDAVTATVAALLAVVDDRDREVTRAREHPDLDLAAGSTHVVLDGHDWRRLEVHPLIEAALRAGGLYVAPSGQYLAGGAATHHAPDPAVVAEGRGAS